MQTGFRGLGVAGGLALLVVVCLLLSTGAAQAVEPPERDYWPTKGWRISTPNTEGMDEAQLLKAIPYIIQNNLDIRSLLVVKNGYLVFENYYAQGMPDKYTTVHSVTKSITSALIGIAHHQGILPDLDQGLGELLPRYFKDGVYPQKADITLRHLLTMSSGVQPVKTKFKNRMMIWYNSEDRVKFFRDLPMMHPPGSTFNYCNASSHLLSVILTKKSGMSTEEFAQKHLFNPLGIKPFFWPRDNQGYTHGSGGVQLTARQMAKFGFLYLNKGMWDGKQVVPKKWVAESTSGLVQPDRRYQYGYLWWVRPAAGHPSFRAWGHGGQFIVVVPDLDLVIVTKSNTYWPGKFSGNFSPMFDIIARSVIEP
jgi:CubicO group peptidase (beta-lactamase class C family)